MSQHLNLGMDNVSTLRSAVSQFAAEYGVAPTFVLTSADVATAIFREVENNSAYRSLINVGGPDAPMTINLGTGPIEIAQCSGRNRVELLVDPALKLKVGRA